MGCIQQKENLEQVDHIQTLEYKITILNDEKRGLNELIQAKQKECDLLSKSKIFERQVNEEYEKELKLLKKKEAQLNEVIKSKQKESRYYKFH